MPGEAAHELRSHPDYKAGYEAALRGDAAKTGSAAYLAGHRAATDARNILGGAGFTETAPGQFNHRTTITR